MLTELQISAHNSRVSSINLNKMTVDEQSRHVAHGGTAERILADQELAKFIVAVKFDIMDELGGLSTHTEDSNNKRIALGNQIAGLDRLIDTLKSAVTTKDRILVIQKGSIQP